MYRYGYLYLTTIVFVGGGFGVGGCFGCYFGSGLCVLFVASCFMGCVCGVVHLWCCIGLGVAFFVWGFLVSLYTVLGWRFALRGGGVCG